MISCRAIKDTDKAAWDAFVTTHPDGSPFHLLAWRDTIETNFGYRPEYQVAMEAGRIVGVLPLFVVDNFLTKRVLISTPFAVYGGVLATSHAAQAALSAHAEDLAAEMSVQYLELRNSAENQRAGFNPITRYATFTKAVTPKTSEELLKSLPSKTRNMVRKSLKNPYTSRSTGDLSAFYELLLETYRRHGTPAFPLAFFESIVANFGPMVDVREVLLGDKVMAASLNFLFRGRMHTYYAASSQEHWALAPNTYMYFDHIL